MQLKADSPFLHGMVRLWFHFVCNCSKTFFIQSHCFTQRRVNTFIWHEISQLLVLHSLFLGQQIFLFCKLSKLKKLMGSLLDAYFSVHCLAILDPLISQTFCCQKKETLLDGGNYSQKVPFKILSWLIWEPIIKD